MGSQYRPEPKIKNYDELSKSVKRKIKLGQSALKSVFELKKDKKWLKYCKSKNA